MRNVTEVRLADKSSTGLERLEFIARDPDNPGDFVVIEEIRSPKKGLLNLVTMRHHRGRAPRALDNQPFSLTSETIPDNE